MVDAEDLVFFEVLVDRLVEAVGRLEIVAERLLHDDAGALDEPARRDLGDRRRERGGRNREVDEPFEVGAAASDLGETLPAVDVAESLGEGGPRALVELRTRELADRSGGGVAELGVTQRAARVADDMAVPREEAARWRLYRAGSSLRLARSPVAPTMTMS